MSVRRTSHPSIRKERTRNNPTDNNNSTTTTNNISYHIISEVCFVSFRFSVPSTRYIFHQTEPTKNYTISKQKIVDIYLSIYLYIYDWDDAERRNERQRVFPLHSIPYNSFVNTYNNNQQPPTTQHIMHTYILPATHHHHFHPTVQIKKLKYLHPLSSEIRNTTIAYFTVPDHGISHHIISYHR